MWNNISDYAKDLLQKLICVDPNERYSVFQALKHPWVDIDFTEEQSVQHCSLIFQDI